MANAHPVPAFRGDRQGENPQEFIKAFKRAQDTRSDAQKAVAFENWLVSNSVAEAWYDNLPSADKATWPELHAAFNIRWPKKPVRGKTTQEYEQEMIDLKLDGSVVGKKEMVDGAEVYSHVVWADKMTHLINAADVGSVSMGIAQCRKELPYAVRKEISGAYTTWTAFVEAVREIDVERVKDSLDMEEREGKARKAVEDAEKRVAQAERKTAEERRQMLSLSQIMANTSIAPPQAPYTRFIPPCSSPGTGMGPPPLPAMQNRAQPRTPWQPRPAPTLQEVEAFKKLINDANLPHHPNTAAGCVAHQAQQQLWIRQHPERKVTAQTPYPLTPGTDPINSGECYQCGRRGHRVIECSTPEPQWIHEYEHRWRSISSFMLRNHNPTPIRRIAIDSYGTYDQDPTSSFDNQGNGEGLFG